MKLEVVDEINDVNLVENYVDETYYEDQKIETKPEFNSQIKKRKHKSQQEPNWYCKVCKLIGKKIDSTILRAYLNPTKVSNTCQICNKSFRKELTSHEGEKNHTHFNFGEYFYNRNIQSNNSTSIPWT